jgi:hypothetical protein
VNAVHPLAVSDTILTALIGFPAAFLLSVGTLLAVLRRFDTGNGMSPGQALHTAATAGEDVAEVKRGVRRIERSTSRLEGRVEQLATTLERHLLEHPGAVGRRR